jgi:tRNA (cmo5U34)-methyltransferase
MDHAELVRKHFNMKYYDYDNLIRKLIPHYEDMHSITVDAFTFDANQEVSFLDLGIGTGQTALSILKKFPKAKIHGIDLSSNMIEQGKERLHSYESNVRFEEINMADFQPTQSYDGCVGVLSIHHLNEQEKPKLFKKIYSALKPGGIFVIGDIVKFDTEQETMEKEGEWRKFLIARLGSEEGDFWFQNYQEEDLPSSVPAQLIWLREAGFVANCPWSFMNYAVIKGFKKK